MGVTTDGRICFGILFEEDYEFPWDAIDDIEEWWLEENNFSHSIEIYDETGNYKNGRVPSEEEVDIYWAEQNDFLVENPIPIELVNCCSCDCPIYILAIPRTVITASRGCPEIFNPEKMKVSKQEVMELFDFCVEYLNIEEGTSANWYLSSLWC